VFPAPAPRSVSVSGRVSVPRYPPISIRAVLRPTSKSFSASSGKRQQPRRPKLGDSATNRPMPNALFVVSRPMRIGMPHQNAPTPTVK
jgi:hypothetical protein